MDARVTAWIPLIKGLHIAAILLWAAGLIALPLLLAQHERGQGQQAYQRIRRFTHYGYTHLLTPAAVIAVAAGTALLFLREVFVPWMFGKLLFVGLLVGLHAWIGNLVVRMGEHGNQRQPSPILPLVLLALLLCAAIFAIVLSKPSIDLTMPDWLTTPRGRQLPVDEVPI
ncbi:putative membrane protein [Sphingobium sp. B1D7B]|uniref:CopD family protein n=1 Tax=unclassified Sphingobium TaxID=2611147 RepID=UPI0022247B28|nr:MULTISPECIES: CopD family protein [unclassified Sphingobium]MCW2405223.1 putative membrane protein [Sphingobium sp. B1D7B]